MLQMLKNSMDKASDGSRVPFSREFISNNMETGWSLERLFDEELSKASDEFPGDLKSELIKKHFVFIDG